MKRTTRLFPSAICIVILTMAYFSSAVSAIAAEANEYEQLAPMQYQSISDMLDESEQHIADWISTPRKSYSFDDYVVCIEEIATDGYQGYASVSIDCPIETYEFVPSKDVADAAATLGLEPPEFQAILTPFQLYTPGLTVRQDANEKVVIAPTYAADGTPYAWLLSTADGKLICDGRTYQQFPSDVSLCLYHLSPTYELVHVWKLQNADGRLVSTASSLGLSDGQYTAQ